MIYLSPPAADGQANRRALMNIPAAPDSRVLRCGPGWAFVFVDARRSSPNTLIGIQGATTGEIHVLGPGDIAPVNPRDAYVRVSRLTYHNTTCNGYLLLGFGTRDELPLVASRPRGEPAWPYNVLACEGGVAPAPQIPTQNLRSMRVLVQPLDAGGAIIDPAPAGFAATIRPSYLQLGGMRDSDDYDPLENTTPANIAGAPFGDGVTHEIPGSDYDLTATPTQQVFDVPVLAGAPVVKFTVSGLAGAGVVGAVLQVDGSPY